MSIPAAFVDSDVPSKQAIGMTGVGGTVRFHCPHKDRTPRNLKMNGVKLSQLNASHRDLIASLRGY